MTDSPAASAPAPSPASAPSTGDTGDTAERPYRVFASSGSRYYPIFAGVFASLLIISNISATKGVTFGPIWGFPINTDGGFLLFPLAYVLGDVLSEVYGFKATRKAILMGFGIAIGAVAYFWIVTLLPGAQWYTDQKAFVSVLGVSTPLILLASLLGFLAGQSLNSWVVVKMKEWQRERHLWARLLGSTVVGEFADTLIFCSIAAPVIGFGGFGDYLNYLILGFFYKCAVEAAVLPVTYRVIAYVKRREPTYAQEATDERPLESA